MTRWSGNYLVLWLCNPGIAVALHGFAMTNARPGPHALQELIERHVGNSSSVHVRKATPSAISRAASYLTQAADQSRPVR